MKKRKLSLLVAATLLCALTLSGCGDQKETSGDTQAQAEQETKDSEAEGVFTVTFYDADGTTVLSTEEVKSGENATEYIPEKEGATFMGWYGTPSLTHEFDFAQPITADTKVFAGFLTEIEDTRTYALVGNGTSPLLLESSWGKVINDEHYMTKAPDANVYTITADICAGDEFQFAIDTTWAEQRGGGYLVTTDLDGVSYFSVAGGFSEDNKKANIKCEVSGNYTFTLTTHPDAEAYDTIEWVYNGEMQAGQVELDVTYYIKGAIITEWEDRYDEMYAFTEDNGIHTLEICLEEGDEFLFTTLVMADGVSSIGSEYVRFSNIVDEDSLSYVDGSESYNMIAKQTGTYTFTYDPESTELKVDFVAE